MTDFLATHYPWIKALHVVSVIAWMAGMLYLPRLYVYHAAETAGSATSETFKVMERRLLRAIVNPAMVATLLFGLLMLWANPGLLSDGWFHGKLLLLLAMFAIHGFFSRWRKDFAADANRRSQGFYRLMNEAPTVLMVGIVLLAVAKPF
jgi:putative membrane protein